MVVKAGWGRAKGNMDTLIAGTAGHIRWASVAIESGYGNSGGLEGNCGCGVGDLTGESGSAEVNASISSPDCLATSRDCYYNSVTGGARGHIFDFDLLPLIGGIKSLGGTCPG